MSKSTILNQVRELISEADFENAFDTLQEFLKSDEEKYRQLLNLTFRYESLYKRTKSDEQKGVISAENAKLNYNQAVDGLLNVINFVETENLDPEGVVKKKKIRIGGIVGFVLIGLIALTFFIKKTDDCPDYDLKKFNVLLLPFTSLDGIIKNTHLAIQTKLQSVMRENSIDGEVKISQKNLEEDGFLDFPQAGDLAKECNADFIVWGLTGEEDDKDFLITRYKFIGDLDGMAVSQYVLDENESVDTIKTVSAIISSGNFSGPLSELINFLIAISANAEGNSDLALKTLNETNIEVEDSNAFLTKNAMMADILMTQGKDDEALEVLDTIIKTHPNYWLAWNNHGMIEYKQENYTEAVSDFSNLLKLKPKDSVVILEARAKAYFELEEYKKAETDFQAVQKVRVDDRRTKSNLEKTELKIREQNTIIERANARIEANPRDSEAYEAKADALVKIGKPLEARETIKLEREITHRPSLKSFMIEMEAEAAQGNLPEARKIFDSAIQKGFSKEEMMSKTRNFKLPKKSGLMPSGNNSN